MKNIKLLAGIFLIVTFFSCTNEPIDSAINLDDFGGNNNQPAVFKADFSGTTWTATTYQAVISSNSIQIVGTKPNGDTFAFMIEGNAVGNYAANSNLLTFTPSGSEFGYWSVNNSNPAENTGSISITNIDTVNKKISGTFVYKGYWSDTTTTSILPVQFTNGVFTNIPYTSSTPPPSNYYVRATQDGVAKDWSTAITASYVLPAPNARSLDIIGLNGASSIGLHISNDTGAAITTGVYPFVFVSVGCNYSEGTTMFSTDYSNSTISSGNITITEFDTTSKTIKGTFNFTGKDNAMTSSKVFTNGEFYVHYTQ